MLSYEDELVAAETDATAFERDEPKAAVGVEVENLLGRRRFIRISADPIDDVAPAVHAALTDGTPGAEILEWIAVLGRARESFRLVRDRSERRKARPKCCGRAVRAP